MTDRDILIAQLREGNMGAGGYFTQRVDMFLRNRDVLGLEVFMQALWPAFKAGVDALQRQKLAARTSPEQKP